MTLLRATGKLPAPEGSGGEMDARTPTRLQRTAAILALCVGLVALIAPVALERVLLHDAVSRSAESRVDRSLERNALTFVSLSGLKAVMASIEGSSIGVGFHLQVGDLIQPAYDYVDFVWRLFLYALAVLGFYKLVMETGVLDLGFPLLGVGLLLWSASALPFRGRAVARRAGRRALALGLAVAYVVPLSLWAASAVAERYLEPLKASREERIGEADRALRSAADAMLSLREKLSLLEPAESLAAIRDEARVIAAQASDAIWARLQSFLAFVLILLVELLLLPFLSAFLIYRVLTLSLRNLDTALLGQGGEAAAQ